MKKSLVTLFGLFAFGAVAYGSQMREFWNAEKTKSFTASLVSYTEKTNTVVVRNAKGKLIKFSADNLSEDDQKYVIKKGATMALAKDLRIRLKKNEGELEREKSGITRISKRKVGYEVTLTNDGGVIEDVEIRYTIFYEKGMENGPSIPKTKTGNIEIETLAEKKVAKRFTSTLTLERMSKPPSSTGG